MEVHPSTVKCLSWLEDGYEKLFSFLKQVVTSYSENGFVA